MAHYFLVVWGPSDYGEFDTYGTQEERDAQMEATGAFNDRLREEGSFVYANGLTEPSTATVVDGTGAEPIFTDGPYLESKEYFAGLWIVDVPDLDAALMLAAEGSKACGRKVEVRPTGSV
ncbi:hypothetical protein BKA04_001507 [Cryobacterium mesophilum]|uniref:YCII-related domain-containing protein n=1 Tax=Terrimesophilobacter mesophilus TaxID=433647 RepID=A0A4R8VBL4_9MICO|nr:YciI family protein [Terrimesophilobacter mesophilus]MBB5633284.1 hypothetical protein [Terrimesophilobacter mesophilus]TFB80025.1 hypothetical protein E3N84_08175 [Terrimesophilobacter mesophilus]